MSEYRQLRAGIRIAIAVFAVTLAALLMLSATDKVYGQAGNRDEVQSGEATMRNPIKSVIFEERTDGNYDVYVTLDGSVYSSTPNPVRQWVILDGDTGNVHTGWSDDTVRNAGYTLKISTSEWNYVEPGDTISLAAGAYYSVFTSNNQADYNWSWGESGKNVVMKAAKKFTAPISSSSSTERFEGFYASYFVSNSLERVELEYSSYEGSMKDEYSENVFLREDPSAGTIKVVDYITRSHYATDSDIEHAKKYYYYVVKEKVLESTIPGLLDKAKAGETGLSTENRNKLLTISAYTKFTTPGPRVVYSCDLGVTKGVRTAYLKWKSLYETDDPNVSGYTIRVYKSDGSVYKTINYKSPSTVYESYTVSNLPYKGTFYFTVTPYFDYNGSTYTGEETDKAQWSSLQLSPASGSVTKISNTKVRITIKKPQGATGVYVQQYYNGKWNNLGKTTDSSYVVLRAKENTGFLHTSQTTVLCTKRASTALRIHLRPM